MKLKSLLFAALAIAGAAPASAEWLKATSRHFVIYSDTKEAELRGLATGMERFDAAMRRLFRMEDPDETAANPVTIFVLDDTAAVEALCRCSGVAGFYLPRAQGAVAFTPRRNDGAGSGALRSQIVLFHEYGHHFLLGSIDTAMPAWFSEGFAEFVSTTRIEPDRVQFGYAANHRADGLRAEERLTLRRLFAPERRLTMLENDQIYGRGWLLTHYLTFNRPRAGQLQRYLAAFGAGKPPLAAATETLGDLKQLDRELNLYMHNKLPGVAVPIAALPPVVVDVRRLTAGERALIGMRMTSTRGVDTKAAAALIARAKRANVPANDAVAQGWLAEMAYDAGLDDEAEIAADRALAVDAGSVQALLYKARVRLRRAEKAKVADAKVWAEARSWIVKANRANNNHAGALQLFHDSFLQQGTTPGANAVAGLRRALELAPQDPDLRFAVARSALTGDRTAEARAVLAPLAYAPHADDNNPAQRLIALIDSGKSGTAAMAALEAETKGAAAKKD